MLGAKECWGQGLWFRGFRVLDVGGYRVLGSGFRVLGFRVYGLRVEGFRAWE